MAQSSSAFAELGYAVLKGFVRTEEIAAFARAVERALIEPRDAGMRRPGNDLVPLRWNDGIVAGMVNAGHRLDALSDVLQPRDLKWLSAYITTKRPHSPPLWWHQDWWCWDHPITRRPSAAQVAVLVYLADTDVRSGALRVLPGSHRKSMAIHATLPEPHGASAEALPAEHVAFAPCEGEVTLGMQAGDAVVLDYRLLHGTHANEADRRRDAILLSFLPNWRELPVDLKAHLICHLALPAASEMAGGSVGARKHLLPQFEGTPRSLPVNRVPPPGFAVSGQS